MRSYSDAFRGFLIEGGVPLNADLLDSRLLSAGIQYNVEQESEFEFVLRDPGFEYFKSFGDAGPLDREARYQDMLLSVAGYTLEGGADGQGQLTMKLRPRGVQKLRKITGPLTRENISASQYVSDAALQVGMTAVTQESPQRPSISRDVSEEPEGGEEGAVGANTDSGGDDRNEWSTIKRLAGDEQFIVYEYQNILYFATPQWLFENQPSLQVAYRDESLPEEFRMVGAPSLAFSISKRSQDEISFVLPISAAGLVAPGNGLQIIGLPFKVETLMVTQVSYPLAGLSNTEITAKKPWVVEKREETKSVAPGGSTGNDMGPGGTGNADFYASEIIAAAKARNLGTAGARNGIATALVETNLQMYANSTVPESLNYPHDAVGSNGTSCGLFQQQQNGAWGTLAENMNARASAGLFFNEMMTFDWQSMDPGAACQRVQRSAFPDAYGTRMAEAMEYVDRLY